VAAGKRDITIIKGDDYAHVVTLNTRVAGVLTPVDITGRTYTAQLRKIQTQTTPDATLTCIVTDAAAGEITITLANSVTEDLRADCYHWDLQQNAGGILNTILRGKANVVSDVTR
jgi:hypothetical protein